MSRNQQTPSINCGCFSLILTILCLALVGCEPDPRVNQDAYQTVWMGSGQMAVSVVVLDGNEYYATKVHGGYTLCPKLPPKPAPTE